MGIGYSAAVNDFALMRAAARSLGLAVVFSLITSALYFTLSPLADARSEILARTSPTIWDVLIAVFGGFAGIIGITRREKSNVIPGVAIATALMPPLCTAGSASRRSPGLPLGALYLFTINSVFIATATLVMVRVMRVPEVAVLDDATRARARRAIAAVVLVTGVPSIYLALRLVQQEVFVARAEAFVASAFPRELGTYVVSRDVSASTRAIRVTVVGEPVTDDRRIALEQSLRVYGLDTTELQVDQTRSADVDVASIKAEVAGDLYQDTFVALEAKTHQIETLQQQIDGLEATRQSLSEIAAELRASRPDASGVAVGLGSVSNGEQPTRDVLIVSLDLERAVVRRRARSARGLARGALAPQRRALGQRGSASNAASEKEGHSIEDRPWKRHSSRSTTSSWSRWGVIERAAGAAQCLRPFLSMMPTRISTNAASRYR